MFSSLVWLALWDDVLGFLPRLGTSAAVFAGFWIGGGVACRVIRRLGETQSIDDSLTSLLGRVAKIGLLLFGAITALGTLGVDVTALVAGLGLTGFALGFALKDIVSNVLAGILVIIYKPFEPGDTIAIGADQGKVLEINLRYTVLESGEKRVFVPNSLVFSKPVVVTPAEG